MPQKTVLWAFNLTKWNPTQADMLLATSCLQIEEKDRLARFVFKNDVKSSLIGRLLMRKFVNETSGQAYNLIKFLRDDKGKPFLEGGVNFNVSHQGDYTIFGGNIAGVDVVKFERPRGKSLNEYFRVMGRIFSGSEWEVIKGQSTEETQLGMFCRHWCLKESYLKAIGVGVTINLQDVCFKIHTLNLRVKDWIKDTEVYYRGVKQGWEFQEMLLDHEHAVAVAFNKRDNEGVVFEELDFKELMANAVPLFEPDIVYCNNYFKKDDKN